MQTSQPQPSASQMYNTLVLVLGQFLISVVILAGLLWSGMVVPQVSASAEQLSSILLVLGLVFVAIGIVLKRKLLGRTPSVSGSQAIPNPRATMNRLFPAHVVAFACFEAAAVLGFLLYYMGGSTEISSVLFAMAGACMIMHWPSRAQFESERGVL